VNKFVQWQKRMAGCQGKTQYRSWTAALDACKRLNRERDGIRLHPYHCKFCHGTHIGGNNAKEVQ
jgi:hypothetical protein